MDVERPNDTRVDCLFNFCRLIYLIYTSITDVSLGRVLHPKKVLTTIEEIMKGSVTVCSMPCSWAYLAKMYFNIKEYMLKSL